MANKNPITNLAYVLNIIAVLTLLVVWAIYFGIGFLPEHLQSLKNLVQSICSDISAVLITFLVISFILDRKGLSPSNIFKEDFILDLLKRYPTTRSFLNSAEANSQFDIVDKLKTSKEVYMVGWSLALIQKISHHIIDAIINNGTKIKIIITEPKSHATKFFRKHQVDNNIEHDLEIVLAVIDNFKKEIAKHNGKIMDDLLEIRFCSWIPSSCLMFSNPNMENGTLRMMIYPLSVKTNHTSIVTYQVIPKKAEPIVFDYFLNEFETLWSKDSITEEQFQQKSQNKKLEAIETVVYESYFRDQLKFVYEYRDLMKNSETIDIIGYTCKTIVEDCKPDIVRSVLNGSHLRIVIIEPNSLASQLIMDNSRMKLIEGDIQNVITRVSFIIKDIENQKGMQKGNVGSFEVRFINWVPGFSLFLVNRDMETGSVKLTLHHLSYYTPDKDPALRKLILKSDDTEGFNYLCKQFQRIWEQSVPLEEVMKKKLMTNS